MPNSIFGSDKEITNAQYLSEFICKKSSEMQKLRLPNLFWKNPDYIYWTKRYKTEIIAANGLLKIYDFNAIILAMKDKRCKWVQSYHNKRLHKIIQEKQRDIDMKTQLPIEKRKQNFIESTKPEKTIRIGKINKLNRLKD